MQRKILVLEVFDMKFYICEHCGNIVEFVKETGVPVTIISTGPDLKDTIDLRDELL